MLYTIFQFVLYSSKLRISLVDRIPIVNFNGIFNAIAAAGSKMVQLRLKASEAPVNVPLLMSLNQYKSIV